MRFLSLLALTSLAAAPAFAQPLRNGGDLAQTCRAFAAQPDAYAKTPEGVGDHCRKFLEGYFRTLKDRRDAELKALADNAVAPAAPGPCVRMPDELKYRDFAGRIAAFDQANPSYRTGSPYELAQKTLEANFPCPIPPAKP